MTEEELKKECQEYGLITDLRIMKKDNQSRGFGFIGFSKSSEAEIFYKKFNNLFLKG